MPARKSRPLTPEQARNLDRCAAALKQAAAELNGLPKLRHGHMLVQAGLHDAGETHEGDGYSIEDWEAMEVRRFSSGRPGYGMIQDTVSDMRLTSKGRDALARVVQALES
jgi:hypothetical protein